jgi:Ran GTPase-activating protein (RanGAP) involved in mRNA processing and transport
MGFYPDTTRHNRHDSGALTSLNLLKNCIEVEQAQELVELKEAKPNLSTLCGLTMKEPELDFHCQGLLAGDVVLLSSDIKANGALFRLNLSGNKFGSLAGALATNDKTAIGSLAAALATTTISELNLAGNGIDSDDADILTPAILVMLALSDLNLSGNKCFGNKDKTAIESLAAAVVANTRISKLNLAGTGIDTDDAGILAPAILATRTLSNLHVGLNGIPKEQMRAIIDMDKFDVLCAVPIRELKANSITELGLSGKSLGTEGALVLSAYLKDSVLSKLDLSGNELRSEGLSVIAEVLNQSSITQLNLASNLLSTNANSDVDFSGIAKFADFCMSGYRQQIPGMMALSDLNLADNALGAAGAKIIAEAIPKW